MSGTVATPGPFARRTLIAASMRPCLRSSGRLVTRLGFVLTGMTDRQSSKGQGSGRDQPGGAQDLFEVVAELLGARRVAELGQRLGLDLADAFPGHPELPAHLLQRPGMAVHEAEPELDHLLLALGE